MDMREELEIPKDAIVYGRHGGLDTFDMPWAYQVIAEVFRDKYDFLTEETIESFKKMGHGRAPNGECGTLYAAKYIFEKNGQIDKIKEVEQYFVEVAGDTKCKEIIKKKIPFCFSRNWNCN